MLQRWWKRRSEKNLLGLDITSDSIKLLRINSSVTPHIVEKFAMDALPEGAITKEGIKDPIAVAASLKNVAKQIDCQNDFVAFAVPRSSVIIKNTTIDRRLSASEIESRAWIEAKRHFPDLVGEIYLDYSVTGSSAQDQDALEMMLVACRKDYLNPYLDLIKQSGLVAQVVDVNCYAYDRALRIVLQDMPPVETVALLNVDVHSSSLIVLHQNNQIYAYDHAYTGHHLMKLVDEYLQGEGIAATIPAEQRATLEDQVYMNVLRENLGTHLRHSLHFFYSSRSNISIQKIILSGDVALIPHLTAYVQQESGIETLLAHPMEKMTVKKEVDEEKLRKHSSALMLCCGLGMSTVRGVS